MKRFLSIMLTVMLVLSSFVMVSAEEDAFSVIKVTEEETLDFGTTYTGYYKISADVYVTADVTDPTIEATLAGEKIAEGTIDSAKKDQWQTVSFDLVNKSADALKFAVTGGAMYVNNIKVDKAYAKTLVYEENFDYYNAGDDFSIANSTAPGNYAAFNTVTTTPQTSFKIASNIGDKAKVGVIDYPRYSGTGIYKFADDGTPLSPTPYDSANEGYEYYFVNVPTINADHVIVEFDLYNAANTLTTDTYSLDDKSKIADKLRFSVIRNDANNAHSSSAPSFTIDSREIKSWGRDTAGKQPVVSGAPNVAPQTWNKVVYELEKETVDGTVITNHIVNYGGSKVKNTTYGAYADFGRLVFNVDQAKGGKFYIDNIKVYVIDEVTNGYVERYAENFEGEKMVVGETVDGYKYHGSWGDHNPANYSFTVATGETGNDTKYGRSYNASIRNETAPTRYSDDGVTPDLKAVHNVGKYYDSNYYKNIMSNGLGVSEIGDVKKTRVSFKYYIPGSAIDSNGKSVEKLDLGFGGQGVKHMFSSDSTVFASIDRNASGIDVIKKWIPVSYEITSTYTSIDKYNRPIYTHDVTRTIGKNQISTTFVNKQDLADLCINVNETTGGIAYIDDIKVETNFLGEEDFSALVAKENVVYENELAKSAAIKSTSDEFKVTSGTFGSSPQSINIVKMPGNTANVKVVTAIYNGDVLYDAAVNDITASNLAEFTETTVELKDTVEVPSNIGEYKFKVFVFDAAEGLIPLAEMVSGTVAAPAAE